MRAILWATAAVATVGATASQALDDGSYGVWLEDVAGQSIRVADIAVSQGTYTLNMAEAPFSDHFLSMRPFKCLEGPDKLWCHVPYPYDIKREIELDLTDLSYDFLFVWKPSGEYGIDLWNGVYYVVGKDLTGLIGEMHEIDMNLLAVPPAAGELRPISSKHLELADPDSHWLPVLRIKAE